MSQKPLVVFGLYGPVLDRGEGPKRWENWRPTVSLFQHEDFLVDRLELLVEPKFEKAAQQVVADVESVSPETDVSTRHVSFTDPWNFEEVFGTLHDLALSYPFSPEEEDYLVHITTGSHVQQICLFLLTESRHFPAKLVQTAPPKRRPSRKPGAYSVIDLNLSRYDRMADRFEAETKAHLSFLKSGIETRNPSFNRKIERIEKVAIKSKAPILLMGPTGAGKSHLAKRIYELKKSRYQLQGRFVEVNCATLRGDAAMSALFGHQKGAFTGATHKRDGHLMAAHEGLLFLDEIGELGLDEQASLLRAVEEKRFFPMGSDREVSSDFQLVAGTNKDLQIEVKEGRFREDLLARINLWTFYLPPLRERTEDIEPNLDYELRQFTKQSGTQVRFNKEARKKFLDFAVSSEALWKGNFRDLNAAVYRMATLADGTRIDMPLVDEERSRLMESWSPMSDSSGRTECHLSKVLTAEEVADLDSFDRVQLEYVIGVCLESRSLSDAGRALFSVSRKRKKGSNDTDRLRKYLLKFGITWANIHSLAN